MSSKLDVVLVRMDKIGDLVVSLTADQHPGLSGRKIHWVITKGLGFIPEQADPPREYSEFQRPFQWSEFCRWVRWLKERQPEMVILLHTPWWASLGAWLARVPRRIGRKSQWHSFLFLNVPIRQKRSRSDRHESDYNFDLIEAALQHLGERPTEDLHSVKHTYLKLRKPEVERSLDRPSVYRVVHPGMGGSALNWPTHLYRELILRLVKESPIVITGTASDEKYLTPLMDLKDLPGVYWMVGQLSVRELMVVLSEAQSVIAPSTGVIHLAASLGTPVVGLYSPRKVEHARRWGPRGPKVTVLQPTTQPGEPLTEDVMARMDPEHVHRALHHLEQQIITQPDESLSPV